MNKKMALLYRTTFLILMLIGFKSHASSNQIIFAGLSGIPPRFIDQGPNIGTGWLEYQTLEVRKGMRLDGFDLKQEWMSPSRIEYEFRIGNPICTFPVSWKNPQKLFGQKPDRLYSIALDFEEEASRFILINNSDLPKFKKHMDTKGDINIDALLEDSNLKIVLGRNKDYGRVTQKLTITDSKGEQYVREPYKHHVELLMVRNNRQLIEMLNARRFNYIFEDAIEDQDLVESGIKKENFTRIRYETIKIKDLKDPNLTFISIVCAINPKTISAMPYLNKWIALNRSGTWKSKKVSYRSKVDHKYDAVYYTNPPANFFLAGKYAEQLKDGAADSWYNQQQLYFKNLQLYPLSTKNNTSTSFLAKLSAPRRQLMWHSLYESDNEVVILNDAQFYHGSFSHSDANVRDSVDRAWSASWNHRYIEEYLSPWLKNTLFHFDFKKDKGLPEIQLLKLKPEIKKLTLFARGLQIKDMNSIMPTLTSVKLESLIVFDAAPLLANYIVANLPKNLIHLNLTNSFLYNSKIHEKISSLSSLKELHLNSTQINPINFGRLLAKLPSTIESLSLGYLASSWNMENAKIFSGRLLSHLKNVDFSVNSLNNISLAIILQALPSSLETLEIGGNFISNEGVKSFFANKHLVKLKKLGVRVIDFLSPYKPLILPPTLEGLHSSSYINGTIETTSKNVHTLELIYDTNPQKGKLRRFFDSLGPNVKNLDLSDSSVTIEDLHYLVAKKDIKHIEMLGLSFCSLNDEAMKILASASFSIDHLRLDGNFIQNKGAHIISQRWLPRLKSLSINFNPISKVGLTSIAKHLPSNLERLELASLFDLDISVLAPHLPKTIRVLNLSGNQLSDKDMEILAPQLPEGLYELDLSGSTFGPQGAWHFAQFMPSHLTKLNLKQIPLESKGIEILAPFLPKTLTELSLSDLHLELPAINALVSSMPPQLRSLEFESIRWDGPSAELFLSQLPTSLSEFHFTGVPISEKGANALAKKWPQHLQSIKINGASLGDLGLKALSTNFPYTLRRLELNNNNISDQGILSLSLLPLEHVLSLRLSNNKIGFKGLKALTKTKRSLNSLQLSSCNLDEAALEAMSADFLSGIYRLTLSGNPLSNYGISTLVKRMSPHTRQFFISSVGLGPEGAEILIKNLPNYLTRLEVSGNDIGENAMKKLQEEARKRGKEGAVLEVIGE